MSRFDRRLAHLIIAEVPFTSDDLTASGTLAMDAAHAPNAKQNGIGAVFAQHSKLGHIRSTGQLVRSTAPHRKGGAIRVWQGTAAGRQWASSVIEWDM